MKNNKEQKTRKKNGFASLIYVLVLGIALIGGLVAYIYPNQVKNRIVAGELSKQNMRSMVEADAYNVARGTVEYLALGMEKPADISNTANPTPLYKNYTETNASLKARTKTLASTHNTLVKNKEASQVPLLGTSYASVPLQDPAPESTTNTALANGDGNVRNTAYNLGHDSSKSWLGNTGWGSPNYVTLTSPFYRPTSGSQGWPTLHATYTYGLGHPAEYNASGSAPYTIRNSGTFQSPIPPVNLNPFSGWGFYVNPRATNGYALYPPELFPGLALNGKPMLGRLHVYQFDRKIKVYADSDSTNLNRVNPEIKYRTKVLVMEIPYQGAVDYEGELRVDATNFWNNSTIAGVINAERLTGSGTIRTTGGRAGVQTTSGTTGTATMDGVTLNDASLKTTAGSRDLAMRRNTSKLGDTRSMVRSFLFNPARMGDAANTRNWFEWPRNGTTNQSSQTNKWETLFNDTNTGGGPSIDQYNCGVTQADLHLRLDKISGNNAIRVYKMRSDGADYVGYVRADGASVFQAGYAASGGVTLKTAIPIDNSSVTINLQQIATLFRGNIGGNRQTTNREWPIRGISIYKDPNSTWTGGDPTILIEDATDLNDYHEGLAIVSQFNLQVTQSFNQTVVAANARGPAWRYRSDPMLATLGINTGTLKPPAAIYAPTVRFFSGSGSSSGELELTGAILQKGSAPFLPPTSSGANPVTNNNKTRRITGSGKPQLGVFNGGYNGNETIQLRGIRHQVEMPPIIPARWLVTYVVEEYH